MKTVLKCDFCSSILPVGEELKMKHHEIDCRFNPLNQTCATCKHTEYGYEGFRECLVFPDKDIFKDEKYCLSWEMEA